MRRMAGYLAMVVAFLALACGGAKADPGFERWVAEFWKTAEAEGVSRSTFEEAFRGVRLDPDVLRKASHQPEFVKPIWDYLDAAVSEARIRNGREKLIQYQAVLDAIERAYGVDRHVLVAIWGMESSYGAILNDSRIVTSVVQSLATLAYADPRRAKFAREQLIAALRILERGDVGIEGLNGSWAGAMGHTQFIPTSYEAYAVDVDGDGRRNIWTSPADALGSAANLLARNGWVGGATWGHEVALPAGFDYRLADEETARTLAEWEALGVRRTGGHPFPRPDDRALLLLPAGARGPAFLMLRNHYVIKRYNNAIAYALAVGHLADRLRGEEPFAQSWPRDERPLTHDEAREVQERLAQAGLYAGDIDGKIGPASRAAVRAYQARAGIEPDGHAGAGFLSYLRGS